MFYYPLTLLGPAFSSISKDGGAHSAPINIFGLNGVRVPILFGNDFLWNDSPYSKGFMNFGCLEPSKIMFDFEFFRWSRGVSHSL